MTNIIEIGGQDKFNEICDANTDKIIILDFTASWCGPCRIMGPTLLQIAQEMSDKVVLVIADVDQNDDFASASGVSGIPNILLFKGSEKLDSFVGVRNKEQVVDMINQHL